MGQAPGASENLKVCRRTNTSGTMAGHRHLWTGIAFCGEKTPLGFVGDGGEIDGGATGYSVILNSSSGNLEDCLTDAATNSDTRAIGINSLANSPSDPVATRSRTWTSTVSKPLLKTLSAVSTPTTTSRLRSLILPRRSPTRLDRC